MSRRQKPIDREHVRVMMVMLLNCRKRVEQLEAERLQLTQRLHEAEAKLDTND